VILGTAGHIDHGKTALVQALTGVDTDRLPEEKRRGITIELGFAPLALPDGRMLSVVDVPGHEAFVRTMLAGATGVDLALLVVAADEGVMPQTREHVAILALLGIRGGVIALTKRDLVADDEWLALVEDDVRQLVAGTPLADAPLVAVSARTGQGLDALRESLAAQAALLPARDAADLFRMPVDRAFTVKGTGTVVTGTVWSGTCTRDAALRVHPGAHVVRVRGVQAHGAGIERASPGTRAALALAGVELDVVGRGAVIVADEGWRESRVLRAEVALLDDAAVAPGPRTRVRFHLGTADVGARIVVAGGTLAPGGRGAARIVLDAPVVARAGDRFVLRAASPAVTIGGGVVHDPQPPARRARPLDPSLGSTPEGRLRAFVREAAVTGLPVAGLPVRIGVAPAAVAAAIARVDGVTRVGGVLVEAAALTRLGERLVALLDEEHGRLPLEPGTSLQGVRARLGASPEVADHVIRGLVDAGVVAVDGGLVRRAGWSPRLTAAQATLLERLAADLSAAGAEPPSVPELVARLGPDVPALLRHLERDGRVTMVEGDRWYDAGALRRLVGALRAAPGDGVHAPAELRDLLGLSRKYLIPFLEYCDRTGVTERHPDGRRIRRAP
jgi:selenocysteine-specific elongation factor